MRKINKLKKAFTLAEMLASFAIVAFISGLFISSFNNSAPRENIMNYKKMYFTIQQTVSGLINDRLVFPSEDNGFMINGRRNPDGTITFQMIGEEFELVESSNYFCRELVSSLNTVGDLSTACDETNDENGTGIITLSNGMQLRDVGQQNFALPAGASRYEREYIDITVDTNGQRAPNSLDATDSRDRFRIRIYFDGKVTTAPTWSAENAILESGSRAQSLNLREFPDAE